MTKRIGLRNIALKSFQLPLESTADEIKEAASKVRETGLDLYGCGVIDIPKFLKTLLKVKYSGIVALEYEKDKQDPLPGAAESMGYVKGVLSTK